MFHDKHSKTNIIKAFFALLELLGQEFRKDFVALV
jgi:hypothetical protein